MKHAAHAASRAGMCMLQVKSFTPHRMRQCCNPGGKVPTRNMT